MLDSQLNEVQVYAPDGEYLRTIGREGEGPGEFRAAFNLLLLPSGNIGVLQAFPSKIIGLTPDGNPADDFQLPKGEDEVGFKVLFMARNAGDQLAVVYGFNQPSESGFTQQASCRCSARRRATSDALQPGLDDERRRPEDHGARMGYLPQPLDIGSRRQGVFGGPLRASTRSTSGARTASSLM